MLPLSKPSCTKTRRCGRRCAAKLRCWQRVMCHRRAMLGANKPLFITHTTHTTHLRPRPRLRPARTSRSGSRSAFWATCRDEVAGMVWFGLVWFAGGVQCCIGCALSVCGALLFCFAGRVQCSISASAPPCPPCPPSNPNPHTNLVNTPTPTVATREMCEIQTLNPQPQMLNRKP